jgi:long-chain-fatty-acid--CoA ligase ACSBG
MIAEIIVCIIIALFIGILIKNKRRYLDTNNNMSIPPTIDNFIQLFYYICDKYQNTTALVSNTGESITYKMYGELVKKFGSSLITKGGINKGDRVGIIGFNSPLWMIAHLGTICIGGVSVGIYPTNSKQSCSYIINHSSIKVLVVENEKQLIKFLEDDTNLLKYESLKMIISYNGKISDEIKDKNKILIDDWSKFIEQDIIPEVTQRYNDIRPNDPATFIYTSGTTGTQKAAIISHHNIISIIKSFMDRLQNQNEFGFNQGNERIISYLPLNHIAAQMFDIYMAITGGMTVYFADSDALRGTLGNTLLKVKPTIFIGVPRVWEKIEEKIKEELNNLPKWKKTIVNVVTDHLPHIKNNFILEKIGLNHCKYQITAAAPISQETKDFFINLDFRLYDIYGMSETTGPITMNLPDSYNDKSVGKALNNLKIKIGEDGLINQEGEIMVKGDTIFSGYFNASEQTREVFTYDNWMKTGDLGKIDHRGFLYLTGRSKELLITAGGENIPPVPIEDLIKKHIPFINDVIVIGDKRKFLSAIFTLKPSINENENIKNQIDQYLTLVNNDCISAAHQIKKWVIVPDIFTVETGELTPTMKLRRKYISDKYKKQIDEMYKITIL